MFDSTQITDALYRPFAKLFLYHGDKIIHRRGQWSELFPEKGYKNLVIAVNCKNEKQISALIADGYVDLHFVGDTQCFPLYYYEQKASTKKKDSQIIGQMLLGGNEVESELVCKDGISDFILKQAREQYGNAVKKEDIFFYVYGYLHSPKYRSAFAGDLKKSLPRIQLVESSDDFWTFSKAGRKLAHLHLEYENISPPPDIIVTKEYSDYRVAKMRFKSKKEKDTIIFNKHIAISNIPDKAYEYVVNGKSAVEWIIDRYQIKTDKASGIVNNPNLYAEEIGQPEYILNLLLSVIAVSIQTVEIVKKLPDVKW